jgi:hypothetical protein
MKQANLLKLNKGDGRKGVEVCVPIYIWHCNDDDYIHDTKNDIWPRKVQ